MFQSEAERRRWERGATPKARVRRLLKNLEELIREVAEELEKVDERAEVEAAQYEATQLKRLLYKVSQRAEKAKADLKNAEETLVWERGQVELALAEVERLRAALGERREP